LDRPAAKGNRDRLRTVGGPQFLHDVFDVDLDRFLGDRKLLGNIAVAIDEDGVMGEVEQAGLLSALGHFDLEMIGCLAQVPLNAAPNSVEPSNQEGYATKTTK